MEDNFFCEEEIVSVGKLRELTIGLAWDILDEEKKVDLDASCVFYDIYGRVKDAVFFNRLKIDYAEHSGDNVTGDGEGFDEIIKVYFDRLPSDVVCFMVTVNCHSGGTFQNVETASVSLLNGKEKLSEIMLSCKGNHTALIFCTLFRKSGSKNWTLRKSNKFADGKNFQEIEKEMKEELKFLSSSFLSESLQKSHESDKNLRSWNSSVDKRFDMNKGDVIKIEGLNEVKMGLGWDSNCDLDASILMVDYDCQIFDTVSFKQLRSKCGSVVHSGDNRDGVGSGDDEVITVSLDEVPIGVGFLVCIVNIYSNGKDFGDVRGAYCRLVALKKCYMGEREVCRYNLTDMKSGKKAGGIWPGMIMSVVYRNGPMDWKVKAVGEEIGGRTAIESTGYVLDKLKNKILVAEAMYLRDQIKGKIFMCANELENAYACLESVPQMIDVDGAMEVICKAQNVDKMDFFGKSDPYFVIKDMNGNEKLRSEVIKVTLNPEWNRLLTAYNIDYTAEYEVEVYDWNLHSKDDLIGKFKFIPCKVVVDLMNSVESRFDIFNEKKKLKKKKYTNSGVFIFRKLNCSVKEKNPAYVKLEKDILVMKRVVEGWDTFLKQKVFERVEFSPPLLYGNKCFLGVSYKMFVHFRILGGYDNVEMKLDDVAVFSGNILLKSLPQRAPATSENKNLPRFLEYTIFFPNSLYRNVNIRIVLEKSVVASFDLFIESNSVSTLESRIILKAIGKLKDNNFCVGEDVAVRLYCRNKEGNHLPYPNVKKQLDDVTCRVVSIEGKNRKKKLRLFCVDIEENLYSDGLLKLSGFKIDEEFSSGDYEILLFSHNFSMEKKFSVVL